MSKAGNQLDWDAGMSLHTYYFHSKTEIAIAGADANPISEHFWLNTVHPTGGMLLNKWSLHHGMKYVQKYHFTLLHHILSLAL